MKVEEFKNLVSNKMFKSTICGQTFRFLPGDLLAVQASEEAPRPFSLRQEHNWVVMAPHPYLNNETLIFDVETLRFPTTITVLRRADLDFFTTLIEE